MTSSTVMDRETKLPTISITEKPLLDEQHWGDEEAMLAHSKDNDHDVVPRDTPLRTRQRRGHLRGLLVGGLFIFTIMYALSTGLRRFGIEGLKFRPCHGGAFNRARNMSTSGLPTHFTLPSGDKIPSVALGVWRAEPGKVGDAVKAALQAGYRHIDGAWIYRNEAEVGKALEESGVPRKDLWLTSKLWNNYHSPADIEPILDESLSKLRTDYLDLYLVHWPVAFKKDSRNEIDWELTNDPYPTWQKLEELVQKGKIRNIGISNFNIKRIQNLTANPLKIQPAVNQVELSYWNPQPELVKWSKENNLLLEAYSPFGSAEKVRESLEIPEIKEVSDSLNITPAQAYISWHVQRGTVVLPKSVHPGRIEENFQTVRLPQRHFEAIEKAANSHKPQRQIDPSKGWGVDIFE
ncbi:NADP-dependent oxidoreductase domain-containing protein [Coprinopsis sp. MPI-PUGE-AT-0042]|nr:NADP-dependent oxidoreductase domain-containing protein [Coprinopsis sp. MPI-PUGE-AT-0042]